MRTLVWIGIVPVLAIAAIAQGQTGRVRAGEVPPQPLHGEVHSFYDAIMVGVSLKSLCDGSDVIVEGSVETSVGRQVGTWPNSRIETDLWVSITRVLKGPEKLSKLVVSEKGGALGDYREIVENRRAMQPGERYILLLQSDGRPGIPEIPGLARYFVSGGWEASKYLIV